MMCTIKKKMRHVKIHPSINIVDFIQKYLAPHFTSKNQLDVFVEQPLFYKESETYTEPSSLDKIRRLLNKCPKNVR